MVNQLSVPCYEHIALHTNALSYHVASICTLLCTHPLRDDCLHVLCITVGLLGC